MKHRRAYDVHSDKDQMLFTDLEVCEKLSIGRSTLWKMARMGTFPKPIRVRLNICRWHRHDIDQWLEDAVEARNNGC